MNWSHGRAAEQHVGHAMSTSNGVEEQRSVARDATRTIAQGTTHTTTLQHYSTTFWAATDYKQQNKPTTNGVRVAAGRRFSPSGVGGQCLQRLPSARTQAPPPLPRRAQRRPARPPHSQVRSAHHGQRRAEGGARTPVLPPATRVGVRLTLEQEVLDSIFPDEITGSRPFTCPARAL